MQQAPNATDSDMKHKYTHTDTQTNKQTNKQTNERTHTRTHTHTHTPRSHLTTTHIIPIRATDKRPRATPSGTHPVGTESSCRDRADPCCFFVVLVCLLVVSFHFQCRLVSCAHLSIIMLISRDRADLGHPVGAGVPRRRGGDGRARRGGAGERI